MSSLEIGDLQDQIVFGHEHAIRAFNQALDSSRFPHGWLIAGPKGVGKHTLAKYFAKELLNAQAGDALHKFRNKIHPGYYEIKRLVSGEGANAKQASVIRLSQIQAMQQYLHQTIDNHSWRVVVIDDADRMNEQSANRLLKILEEPPERVVFFLISTTENLLPTIRSRTRLLRLSPLEIEELRKALPGVPDSTLYQVYGCPGLACRLQSKEAQVSIDLVKALLAKKIEVVETLVEQVSRSNDTVLLFLELLQRAIAEKSVKLGKRKELVDAQRNSVLFSSLISIEKRLVALNLDKESVVRMVVDEVLAV